MKKVFSTVDEAIHIYANHSDREGRAASVRFSDGILYSYNTAIAEHVNDNLIIINSRTYSNTTSKQQSKLSYAANHLNRIYINHVPYGANNLRPNIGLNVNDLIKNYESCAADLLAKASRARSKADQYRGAAFNSLNELKTYLNFFSIEYQAADLSELQAAAIEADKKAREAEKVRKAEKIKRQAGDLTEWRAGVNKYMNFEKTALRIKGDKIETSRGASIPLDLAAAIWRVIKGIHEAGASVSGLNFKIGDYCLNWYKNGVFGIGCHSVEFTEFELLAKELGFKS